MELKRSIPRSGAMPLLAAAFFLSACGSDPLDPGDDHDDEVDVAGVQVEWLGTPVFQYMDGDPVPDLPLSPDFTYADVGITFLDDQGEALELPAGEEFEVRLIVGDESVLAWEAGPPGPAGGTPHFRVNLQTFEPGSTTLVLQLWHVDEAHGDWESPSVTVIVDEEEQNGGG